MFWKILLLLCLVSLQAIAQKTTKNLRFNTLISGSEIAWQFGDLTDASSKYGPFKIVGNGVETNVPIAEKQAFQSADPDGKAVEFNGKGWLSLDESKALPVPSGNNFTFALRVKPVKSGGLIRTNKCALVLHESGLVTAIIPATDSIGTLFREFPLAPIRLNEWIDLVFRFEKGKMDFIVNGIKTNSISITESILPIYSEPLLIESWRMEEPENAGLPQPAKNWLYERPFTGQMDYVAIWNRFLTDNEVSVLSNVSHIKEKINQTDSQKALTNYINFHDASRRKDTALVEKLGLEMRAFMARDPKRPIYHLTAPMDGLFDPAGAFYYKGQYHVFSYRNMISLLANNPLTHYVSDDLIHWKDRPIAVWPDTELDVKGIWLGNMLYDNQKTPSMLYTSLGKKGKIGVLAKSHDDLISFGDKKPVITHMAHHDGHSWKEGDTWYSITTKQYWGNLHGKTGDGILLLSSSDLINWKEEGEIFNVPRVPKPADDNQKNGLAEFPYLLPFGDKHVLMIGTRPVRYWIGTFDKTKPSFIPEESQGKLLDFLNNFYCFNPSAVDFKGPLGVERRIVMGMNINAMGQADGIPWFGVHVLPRVISREGNRLIQEPVPEAEMLRGKHFHQGQTTITNGGSGFIKGIKGDALEIIAEFQPGSASRFGLKVRVSEDGKSSTKVYFDVATNQIGAIGNLKITSPYPEIGEATSYLKAGQPVKMRVFLDRSLLEVFVNGHAGSGVFTTDPSAIGIDLFSEGGDAVLTSLDAWEMKGIWTER